MIKNFQPLELVIFSALLGDLTKIINQTPVEFNTEVLSENSKVLKEPEGLVLSEI